MNNEENVFDLTRISLQLVDPHYSRICCGDYWTDFSFEIMLDCRRDLSDCVFTKVGELQVLRLNYVYAYNQEPNLFEMFDGDYRETSDCYAAIFDNKERIRKPFRDEGRWNLDEFLMTDLHVLNRIQIDEAFKGNGIAGEASRIYLERFANGNDAYYLKAFPLQFEWHKGEKKYPRAFKGSFRTCQANLCKYYEQLGFRRIGRTPHFFGSVDDFLYKQRNLSGHNS